MADIFVSYARADRERVKLLASALRANGWTVWWDREILAGKDFDDVIQGELDQARCVIVVWSASSIASRWVKTEANEGLKRRVLVPVVLDGSLPPLAFRNIQAIAFDGPLETNSPAFDDLLRSLQVLLGDASASPAESDTRPPETPRGMISPPDKAASRALRSRATAFSALGLVLLTAPYLAYTSWTSKAGPLQEAISSGSPVEVILDDLSQPIGTIKPQSRYEVSFLPQAQAWKASGPVYPDGQQTHTDPVSTQCNPKDSELCIWGAAFRFDERGQVFFVAGGGTPAEAKLVGRRVGRIPLLKDTVANGTPVVVVLDELRDHIGTIKPAGQYEVVFRPTERTWTASGPVYPEGQQSHTDPATALCDPLEFELCIWGAAFRFDERGQVFFVSGGAQTDALNNQRVGRIRRDPAS